MSFTEQFESQWAEFTGTKYAIAHNSATSALHTSLTMCHWDEAEVIMPALMPVMPAYAVLLADMYPVFADIHPETFNISEEDVLSKITDRTTAIIVVHLYGLPAKMDTLIRECRERGILLIEDSAECVYPNSSLRGDIAVYSFERTKHLSTGEGGMAVTNDKTYALLIRKYGGLGYRHLSASQGKTSADSSLFQNPNYKRHDLLGYNYRMPEPCAELGVKQMPSLVDKVVLRRNIAGLYAKAIEGCKWLIPQKIPPGFEHSYFTYAVCLNNPDVQWIDFYNRYKELSGETFYAAWSVPYQEPSLLKYQGDCPVAEYIQPQMMQFKTNQKSLEEVYPLAEALYKTIRYFGG